jgi:sugar phosphate permease
MKHSRWLITCLAFLGLIICILDRSAISYAIKPLETELHLNNTQFGLLSSAFSVGYLVMVFIGGFIVDKFGSKIVWSITAIIWSIATLLMGFSSGLIMIFVLRLVCGLAEGPTGPCIMKSVNTWLPIKERSRALSVVTAASPFASVIGAPLCSYLILKFDWKIMFFILGISGIIWGIVWLILYTNTPEQSKFTSQEEIAYIKLNQYKNSQETHNSGWHFILKNRTLLINNYGFFAFGYLLFFAMSWLPGYLMQTHHLDLKQLGTSLMIPWFTAGSFVIIYGILSDYLWHKTKSLKISRSLIIGISLILSGLCFIPVILSDKLFIMFTFLSLGLGFGMGPIGCFYALNADIAGKRASTSTGIMVSCLAIAGIIAPIITGWLSNISGNFDSAIYLMLSINLSAGLLVLIGQSPDKEV